MQFSTVLVALLPAFAAAQNGPSARGSFEPRAVDVADNSVAINLCAHIAKCVVALAPTVVSCVAAVAEEGLNPIADASCLASAVHAGIVPPAACSGCF